MSLTFYYSPMSTAAITRLVLEELGIPYETVTVDIRKGETRRPEYMKLNPNGKVPMIVHDGTPIWESAAITMYLGETFGVGKNLYPAAGPKRGEAMKWICWTNVTFGDAASRWMRNTADFFPVEQRNAKAAEAARTDLENCLRILDESLADRPFLLGEYSLADTHVSSVMGWLEFMKVEFSSHKRLVAWAQRCNGRPAYARAMAG